jgi:3-dehydroquinate dehydratase/shikimate dehydrogenase
MICISIAQESRRFALVDMINAAKQCDLLEVRLDRFSKAPEVGELLAAKPKPVIVSCRRSQDGGAWEGSEEERLALLRQAIISKADYVEIEMDVANQIRPFPPAKRVISYTNFEKTPGDIADIYADAQTKNADVIKLVTLARTPEESWPLVQILARPALPTVVVGLGRPGMMLTILGQKIGAPWAYAALERGMEVYPGQPTVHDLENVYHFGEIGRNTKLVGVTGFTQLEPVIIAGLNAGLAALGSSTRCLPLQVGGLQMFRWVINAVRLRSVVVDEHQRETLKDVATELEPDAKETEMVDLLVSEDKKWHGYNLLGKAAVAALEATIRAANQEEKPLQGRQVMIVGTNATARTLARMMKQRGAVPIIASRDKDAAVNLAVAVEGRHIQFEALYSTMHDVLVVCSEEKLPSKSKARSGDAGIHAGFLKPGMTVMDLTMMPYKSPLLRSAKDRGCRTVSPRRVLLEHLAMQLRLITGKEAPRDALKEVLRTMVEEEE